jgi:hypothetical protein
VKISVVTSGTNALTPSGHATCKEGGDTLSMRTFALIALAAVAIGFGGCAKDEPASTTTTTTASTGYSK